MAGALDQIAALFHSALFCWSGIMMPGLKYSQFQPRITTR